MNRNISALLTGAVIIGLIGSFYVGTNTRNAYDPTITSTTTSLSFPPPTTSTTIVSTTSTYYETENSVVYSTNTKNTTLTDTVNQTIDQTIDQTVYQNATEIVYVTKTTDKTGSANCPTEYSGPDGETVPAWAYNGTAGEALSSPQGDFSFNYVYNQYVGRVPNEIMISYVNNAFINPNPSGTITVIGPNGKVVNNVNEFAQSYVFSFGSPPIYEYGWIWDGVGLPNDTMGMYTVIISLSPSVNGIGGVIANFPTILDPSCST